MYETIFFLNIPICLILYFLFCVGELKFVGSTENVSKFFTDDGATGDEDGKNFFESFTAAEGTGLEETHNSLTGQPLKVDLGKIRLTYTDTHYCGC